MSETKTMRLTFVRDDPNGGPSSPTKMQLSKVIRLKNNLAQPSQLNQSGGKYSPMNFRETTGTNGDLCSVSINPYKPKGK